MWVKVHIVIGQKIKMCFLSILGLKNQENSTFFFRGKMEVEEQTNLRFIIILAVNIEKWFFYTIDYSSLGFQPAFVTILIALPAVEVQFYVRIVESI